MKELNIEEFKANLIPILDEQALFLYDIVYEKENNETFLRVFLDKKEGDVFDLDACALANAAISQMMDEKYDLDTFELDYLEVSSPGAERILTTIQHYQEAIGEKIYLRVKTPINKEIHIYGNLVSVEDDGIVVNAKFKNLKKMINVAFDEIELAHVSVI